jgi:hypothetical protein
MVTGSISATGSVFDDPATRKHYLNRINLARRGQPAFDQLPPAIRCELNFATKSFSAPWIKELLDTKTEDGRPAFSQAQIIMAIRQQSRGPPLEHDCLDHEDIDEAVAEWLKGRPPR